MLRTEKKVIWIGAVVFLVASYFSGGYHHFDEHFQLLEFAGLKLGLTEAENLPWEYRYQMRPAFQPLIVVVVYRLFSLFSHPDPFAVAFFLRLMSAFLTFTALLAIYRVFSKEFQSPALRITFAIFSFLLWIGIYNGVRFSSENWSGALFLLGFAVYFLKDRKSALNFLLIGALFGLSFLSRYQAALMTVGFMLWLIFIKKENWRSLILLSIGGIALVGVGVLIDTWYYGELTFTALNYFNQNLVEGRASDFGVHPFYWYLTASIERGVPPFSILYWTGFFALLLFRPKSPVVWAVVPFLLVHSLIGHKEMRFIFPILGFVPYALVRGNVLIISKYRPNLLHHKAFRIFIKVFIVVNLILAGVVAFKPADDQIRLYRHVYREYTEPTTLYYLDENPYHRVLDVYFYKRDNLAIKKVDDLDEIEDKGLVVLNKFPKVAHRSLGNLSFASIPAWVLNFNFNNWVERSNIYLIYEVNPDAGSEVK